MIHAYTLDLIKRLQTASSDDPTIRSGKDDLFDEAALLLQEQADQIEKLIGELAQLRAIADAATAFVDTHQRLHASGGPPARHLDEALADSVTYGNARRALTEAVHTWRRHQLRPDGEGWQPGNIQSQGGRTTTWTRTDHQQAHDAYLNADSLRAIRTKGRGLHHNPAAE